MALASNLQSTGLSALKAGKNLLCDPAALQTALGIMALLSEGEMGRRLLGVKAKNLALQTVVNALLRQFNLPGASVDIRQSLKDRMLSLVAETVQDVVCGDANVVEKTGEATQLSAKLVEQKDMLKQGVNDAVSKIKNISPSTFTSIPSPESLKSLVNLDSVAQQLTSCVDELNSVKSSVEGLVV